MLRHPDAASFIACLLETFCIFRSVFLVISRKIVIFVAAKPNVAS